VADIGKSANGALSNGAVTTAASFIHLRVHSAYSLLEGALTVSKIVDFAAASSAPAIAITDTSNLFGALEFAQKASKAGVQPLIGCQLAVDFGASGQGQTPNHGRKELASYPTMVFIAANKDGYANLVRLVSRAFMETPSGEPVHISMDWLETTGDGIIALTGGMAGPVDELIESAHDAALERLARLKATFGDRLYVEIQRQQGYSKSHEAKIVSLAYAEHLPLVATNEAFFLKRDDYESHDALLAIIERMKFPGYFLIVADFIKWAKAHDIPVGPGRGSGAGSLVAYALTITDLDPLRFSLLFERFLNPERVSMPDFDIDFCQDRREEVIRYVQEKYGRDQVAQIITFGALQARRVLRDVGRVLQMPYGQVDRSVKMVPVNPANPVTLAKALEDEPRCARRATRRASSSPAARHMRQKLEGLYRHASTHAAGIVIGDRPLTELVPLYRDPRSDMPVTQFNMKWVEPAGLVKFDFLGLKTLTVLDTAVKLLIKRAASRSIDL
jgi:DNA polymerase III alpha subunit